MPPLLLPIEIIREEEEEEGNAAPLQQEIIDPVISQKQDLPVDHVHDLDHVPEEDARDRDPPVGHGLNREIMEGVVPPPLWDGHD
jgi:hypothetical protein